MAFTTPCFVRVENQEEREELIEWLAEIGYSKETYSDDNDPSLIIIAVLPTPKGTYYTFDEPTVITSNRNVVSHNCGTNIPLFKTLSAMRDDTITHQLHLNDDHDSYCPFEDTEAIRQVIVDEKMRKATKEEIIEYFK